MPTTTPIRKLPYPLLDDPPNVPADMQALALKLDTSALPVFADAAARTAAWSAPPLGAQSLRQDAGYIEWWDGTLWRPTAGTLLLAQSIGGANATYTAGGLRDVTNAVLLTGVTFPFPTRTVGRGIVYFGFNATAGASSSADIYRLDLAAAATTRSGAGAIGAVTSQWAADPVQADWTSLAGANLGIKLRSTLGVPGGTSYLNGVLAAEVYAL